MSKAKEQEQQHVDPADRTLVHAKYLGGTTVIMPDLGEWGRDDCGDPAHSKAEEYAAWLKAGGVSDPDNGPDPRLILHEGDVVKLDRFSAEGRDDFALVADDASKSSSKSSSSKQRKGSDPAGADTEEG